MTFENWREKLLEGDWNPLDWVEATVAVCGCLTLCGLERDGVRISLRPFLSPDAELSCPMHHLETHLNPRLWPALQAALAWLCLLGKRDGGFLCSLSSWDTLRHTLCKALFWSQLPMERRKRQPNANKIKCSEGPAHFLYGVRTRNPWHPSPGGPWKPSQPWLGGMFNHVCSGSRRRPRKGDRCQGG